LRFGSVVYAHLPIADGHGTLDNTLPELPKSLLFPTDKKLMSFLKVDDAGLIEIVHLEMGIISFFFFEMR
jgi:hypothetical protein